MCQYFLTIGEIILKRTNRTEVAEFYVLLTVHPCIIS